MHWKLARDRYLRPLCERHGEGAALEAGFFFDDDPKDERLDDVELLCTPFPKRALPASPGARPVVLLTTGALCPVHAGHVAMMERARDAAEAAGFDVLGGYLSPGHDDYVALKCGRAAIPAHERLQQCAEVARRSGWLSVDPWEALHRRVSVNYTDVAARLRSYLQWHVDPSVDVLYVCGGDNARFAYAFTEEGGCVVVGRPSAEGEVARWRERLRGAPRVLWAEGDHPAASSALRAEAWAPPPRGRIVLRVEDERAVRTLGLSAATYASFAAALVRLFSEHVGVRTVGAGEVPAARAGGGGAVLSLDAMRPAEFSLGISRLFALGGYELLGHVARPGTPPLAEQAAKLPKGRYVLADDDSVTAGTLSAVRALLPEEVVIASTQLAVPHEPDEDVLDARDFLLGADEGGLVVALPRGATARAVYALPFVDPAARASVRASREFSRAVWRLNEAVFAGTSLRAGNLPAPSRALLFAAAVSPRTPLSAVCGAYAERLGDG